MVDPGYFHFDTLSLHAGQEPDSDFGARAVPIDQTTSYLFSHVEHAAGLFNLERQGHIDSRISNPSVAVLEERVASLEGGVGSIAAASGQAALCLPITTLMGEGAHIVSSASIYGGSRNLFAQTLPRFAGITGAIFSFGIRGGRAAWRTFIERLRLFSHLANVGDPKSLVIHPASTTHATMDATELQGAGIGEDLVRLSVGLEDPDDPIADLHQALQASQRE